MVQNLIFDPLLPLFALYGAGGFAVLILVVSYLRGLTGWAFRAVASLALLVAIANPAIQQEEREPLDDIVLAVVDDTASQSLSDRKPQAEKALSDLRQMIGLRPDTELRVARISDTPDDRGTLLAETLADALTDIPASRLAGVVVISDGVVHDAPLAQSLASGLPAPLHLLQTGRESDRDRRISVVNAPAFVILGEPLTMTVRVDDLGAGSEAAVGEIARVMVSVDGGEPLILSVPVGIDVDLPLSLPHGGMNTLQFSTPAQAWELTDRNNIAVLRINGVRDRLRVLLVSGEPHPGERIWRNLLKSDSSVDLVHFTILRPPEKQDGVPVNELSLIAFPTRELFMQKVDEFDLIIFDRYKRRGILPGVYLDSVRDYVLNGGAVLVAAGPDYATAASLWHSGLSDILPAAPTAQVIRQGFHPSVSEVGARHPVTRGLEQAHTGFAGSESAGPVRTVAGNNADDSNESGPPWGRWLRLTELREQQGAQVVMTGLGAPLLVLNRSGEGRAALLGSDHSWLWARGYEGGGPQAELLRRLAHWMMKEPDLEEESLFADPRGQSMLVTRQSLSEEVGELEIITPSGDVVRRVLTPDSPGRFTLNWDAPEPGLYRLREGETEAVVALGPASPLEFVNTIATSDYLTPAVDQTRGGVFPLEGDMPDLRNVRAGRKAHGRGWIGLVPRNAWLTIDVTLRAILPVWAFLLLVAALVTGAWLYEGRR